MRAIIDAPFATPQDVAHLLGVPASRLKRLVTLMNSPIRKQNGKRSVHLASAKVAKSLKSKVSAHIHFKAAAKKSGKSLPKQRATKKSSASSRRHTRGKAAR